METVERIKAALAQCNGSEEYHYNAICRQSGVVYTEGFRTLAMMAECWWLADLICAHQPQCRRDSMLRDMQFWKLTVNEDRSAILTCERDQGDVAFTESIPMTDFPLDHITIWLEPGVTILDGEERQVMVMLLPSEH